MTEPFSHIRLVSHEDIDNLGHMSNVAFVRWLQEVAILHSESVGYGFDAYRRIGGIFVIRRTEIDYLRPALRGDQIELRTWLSSWMAAKYIRETEFRRVSDGGTLVARASVTWGYLDVATGRPTRVPDEIREAFGLPRVSVRKSTPPPPA